MRRWWWVAAAAGVLTVGGACGVQTSGVPGRMPAAPLRLRVRVADRTALQHVTLEEYVRGSILAEFAPAAGDPAVVERMLEVQAVLSRTFAVSHVGRHARDGYDFCATTHCQLFDPGRLQTSRWAGLAVRAARKTAARVLSFEGNAASALFHADCGGHTSDPVAVWGGAALPYLQARVDDGPARDAHARWRYEAAGDAIRLALNADARTAVGARLDGIAVLERDTAGRAVRLDLRGTERREVRGDVLRQALTRRFGPRTIKSTLFTIRRDQGTFVFEGRGFGHGVGLCQAGALARLSTGSSPTAVLQRYFPGTRVVALR
jgi:stage II sporulation protein D